jgi:hypothetical protein
VQRHHLPRLPARRTAATPHGSSNSGRKSPPQSRSSSRPTPRCVHRPGGARRSGLPRPDRHRGFLSRVGVYISHVCVSLRAFIGARVRRDDHVRTSGPYQAHTASRISRRCDDCLAVGTLWLHLRICLECGHVACCDESPHRHANAHANASGHPIIRSLEPGEQWSWCYIDRIAMLARRVTGATRIPPSPLGARDSDR